jgi:GNAT superfamily N-acetyltransferase
MNDALRLRVMTSADLSFADSVRAQVGWNQTIADWERFLAAEPEGCFIAEQDGALAGTATTIVYGRELAWIGMVLVHPNHRRKGIGRALLERCIAHLQGRGVRCIKLDATQVGKQVYDRLGFKSEWTLTRWERVAAPHPAEESTSGPRICRDVDTIEELDTAAFGISRRSVTGPLMAQARVSLVLESKPSRVAAYGLLRNGSLARYLGPLVATTTAAARSILAGLLARSGGRKIFWDIPDQNAEAIELAREYGFARQRVLTRMYLGENTAPGDPQLQFATLGPEQG